MNDKLKNILTILLTGGVLFGLALCCLIKPAGEVSISERRPLAQFPELTVKALSSGEFAGEFEEYAVDQFPMREGLRRVKALASRYLLGRKDDNGIYVAEGYASALEYPLDEASIERAAGRFRHIYDKYLAEGGGRAYLAVIPDKNRFLAERNGYPALDYEALEEQLAGLTGDYLEYIPIADLLELEDYYKTDTHWRQERIRDVAMRLGEAMGVELMGEYTQKALNPEFYGVYYGQAALPMPPEELICLENEIISGCTVYDHETGEYLPVYNLEKAGGQDPYEAFLSGPKSLLTVDNPNAEAERELIVFRDSFGASIVPLLLEGYSSITVVDIRYISSDMLGRLVDFHGQDALFLYSTLVLNNSVTLK